MFGGDFGDGFAESLSKVVSLDVARDSDFPSPLGVTR